MFNKDSNDAAGNDPGLQGIAQPALNEETSTAPATTPDTSLTLPLNRRLRETC